MSSAATSSGRQFSPFPKVSHLGGLDQRLSVLKGVLTVNQGVNRKNAIHIDVVVDGDGPVSSKWRFQETEADLG